MTDRLTLDVPAAYDRLIPADRPPPFVMREPVLPKVGYAQPAGTLASLISLLVGGHFLTLFTVGIYRFWLKTQLRRWYWSNTLLDGDAFEYLGTGRELLIGFLFALGILLPVYGAIVGGAFFTGLLTPTVAGKVFLVFFLILAQYAHYRARRYRMTRTVWRGLRFSQSGRGLDYAALAVLGGIGMLVTLGLATPWVRAMLEGYKVRNTWYGTAGGSFAPRLSGVAVTWMILWIPALLAFAGALYFVWNTEGLWLAVKALQILAGLSEDTIERLPPDLARALAYVGGGFSFAFLWGLLLWPAYKTVEFRAFTNGTRLGPVGFVSRVSIGYLYWATIRFILMLIVGLFGLGLLVAMVAGMIMAVAMTVPGRFSFNANVPGNQLIFVGIAMVIYLLFFLLYVILRELIIVQGFWKHAAERLDILGLDRIGDIVAQNQTDMAIGEGLADALDGVGF